MISIAGDHFAIDLVSQLEKMLKSKNIEFENLGSFNEKDQKSLQEIIPKVVDTVRNGSSTSGILICGTGAGVEIGSNRFKGIRASLCITPLQAKYARIYDNANLLCLSSWITKEPGEILNSWFANEFDGDRHRRKMIEDFDTWV